MKQLDTRTRWQVKKLLIVQNIDMMFPTIPISNQIRGKESSRFLFAQPTFS